MTTAAKKYNVAICNARFEYEAQMSAGPACTHEFSKRVAERHAKEFTAKWGKPAFAVPVGGELVLLIPERIEVAAPRNGKPGYRWTDGYYVCDPAKGKPLGDAKIYPPVPRREAFALARELFGDDCKIIIGK